MRFKRSDLPGFLIAVGAPPLMMLLFLASFETWRHHGTPLMGFMATNIAVAVGVAAIFSRFIRNWDVPLFILFVMGCCIIGVIWMQRTGNDGNALATGLKWGALVSFLVLNVVILLQVINNGLLPLVERREARQREQRGAS